MASLVAEQVHQHVASLVRELDVALAQSTQVSVQQLRRTLRHLDRSLAKLYSELSETASSGQEGLSPSPESSVAMGMPLSQESHGFSVPMDMPQSSNDNMTQSSFLQLCEDLWICLTRLPVWPNEELCVSILQHTVALWELIATLDTNLNVAADAVDTLLQVVLEVPDCLYSAYGIAWVRVANLLRSYPVVVSPRQALGVMVLLLPTIQSELQQDVSTDFVFQLVSLLASVTHDLVVAAQANPSHGTLHEWLATQLTGILSNEHWQVQQQVQVLWQQLADYLTAMVDYAQDELDKACSPTAMSDTATLAQAIAWMEIAFLQVQHLVPWQVHYPRLACTSRMQALWQTLGQADVSTSDPVYESVFLPSLVRLTSSCLALVGTVDLSLFLPMWLRMVPYSHLWVNVTEIWSFFDAARDGPSTDLLRRWIQLVLMTLAVPASSNDQQVCLRLQAWLVAHPSVEPTAADAYFAKHYQPVEAVDME